MKLTFFEKNLFDKTAIEKPTLSTNDTAENLDKIRDDFTDQYISAPLKRAVRQFKIPIEYIPFYTDGEKFVGEFKKVNITSGEPEIISNVTAPRSTKRIDVSLSTFANLAQLTTDEQDIPKTEIRRPALQFEPVLNFDIGNIRLGILNGFQDAKRYIKSFPSGFESRFSLLSAYNRAYNFLRQSSSRLLSEDIYLNNFTQYSPELPDEILKKEVRTPLPDLTYQRILDVKYNFFKNSVSETEYWKIRNGFKVNTFSFKKISLHGSYLIVPVKQTVRYEGEPYQVRGNIDTRTAENGISESMKTYAPFNLSKSDFAYRSGNRFNISLDVNSSTINTTTVFRNHPHQHLHQIGNLKGQAFARLYSQRYGITFSSSKYINFRANFLNSSGFMDALQNGKTTESVPSFFINDSVLFKSSWFIQWVVIWGDIDSPRGDPTYAHLTLNFQGITDYLTSLFANKTNAENYQKPTLEELVKPSSSDFVIPTLTKADLGIGATETQIKMNGEAQVNNNISITHQDFSGFINNPDGSISKNTHFRLNSGPLNYSTAQMKIEGDDDTLSPIENLKNRMLPIRLSTNGNNFYDITDLTISDSLPSTKRFTIIKNNGTTPFDQNELTQLLWEQFGESPRTLNINLSRSGSSATFESGSLFNALRYRFNGLSSGLRTDLRIPTLQSWLVPQNSGNIETVKRIFKTLPIHYLIGVLNPTTTETEAERTARLNLLESIDQASWPWVTMDDLYYQDEKIYMVLSRPEKAPIPNREYFDSVRIAGRDFNFLSASYRPFSNAQAQNNPYKKRASEWSWPATLNFLQGRNRIPLVFRKRGTSETNAVNISRQVQKTTVKTESKKLFPPVLGGFKVGDFDFDSTKLEITFLEKVKATDFQSLAVKSQNGLEFITRELRATDGTFMDEGQGTKVSWTNQPEFFNLKRNKTYIFEMTKGANNSENRFFIPRPGQTGFHFIKDFKFSENDIDFSLINNGSEKDNTPFINFSIKNKNGTIFKSVLNEISAVKKSTKEGFDYSFTDGAQGLRDLIAGDKFDLEFSVQDFPQLDINLIKLTDIYFDTLVLLNTNIDDISLFDQLGNDLIHPADIEQFKSETENGLRHIVLFLKNPVTSGQVTLVNRRIIGSDNQRKIGQIFAMKKIGSFTQFPRVRPTLSHGKTITTDQENKSHVKSLPTGLNYSLTFPPLSNPQDWRLAQDLFSRACDYNEFMIWVSGGDIIKDRPGIRGFQFSDIVKSLVGNEENIIFEDDRLNSGLTFEMLILEVQ